MNEKFHVIPASPSAKVVHTCPKSARSTAQRDVHEARIFVNVVVVYADLEARAIATQVNERFIQQFHQELDFRSAWWSFQVLQEREIMESAAKAAVAADLIFCSTNGSEELPSAAQAWIDLWLPQKNRGDSALIALLRSAHCDDLRPLPADLSWTISHAEMKRGANRRISCRLKAKLRSGGPLIPNRGNLRPIIVEIVGQNGATVPHRLSLLVARRT